MFEHLQNEDTKEEIADENFSRFTDDVIKEKQNKVKNKSYKKTRTDRQRKTRNHKKETRNHKKEKVQKKCSMKRNETISNIVVKRCHGCHVNHFPHPKFCRWFEKRRLAMKVTAQETTPMDNEKVLLIKCGAKAMYIVYVQPSPVIPVFLSSIFFQHKL